MIERNLGKAENFLERAFADFTEALWFKGAESAGTIRVMEAFPDRKFFPGYDIVVLDFGKLQDWDESSFVYRVPQGLLKEDQIAEVFIKRAKVMTDPIAFLVALRPFDRASYGEPFRWTEAHLANMFGYNMKDSKHSKLFYQKFIVQK